LAILFCDIRGFTPFAEKITPYDTVFILNRYFNRMVNVIESYGGRIDNYIGDGLIALFGVNNEENPAVSAVQSAIDMCSEMDEMKPYLKTMYGDSFDIGIGVHYGDAVVGDIGSGRSKRLTAIGDSVNFASRVESANKDFRSRLLISEETHDVVKDVVKIKDFVRTNIKGVEDRVTLYEVEEVTAEVGKVVKEEFMENGLMWRRVNTVSSFDEEPQQVIKVKRDKFLVAKCNDEFVAMNDQCPHAFLSLKGSEIEPDANAIKCRWHNSSFCTKTGDIKSWVNDGMFRFMSRLDSRAKELVEMEQKTLDLFTTKVIENTVWVGIDPEY
jgi:class 3 adenylate cyclase/nitrite reductase/ring-hydroxylating ferredoxin subunit